MFAKRQKFLIETIEEAQKALSGLINGDIQSYTLGTWNITRSRPDVEKLEKWLKNAMIELDSINNILTGRSPRKISTCIYSNPQGVGWWRL